VDRREFVFAALGAGSATIAAPWLESAAAATEDDLAFANFGAATELLIEDFYARALQAKLLAHPRIVVLKSGRVAATWHAKALSELLAGAGDVAPDPEDFEFEWPSRTFRSERTMVETAWACCARSEASTRPPLRRRRSRRIGCSTSASPRA